MSTPAPEILENYNIHTLPRHIAIIMDGNGRWAKQKGLKRVFGHRAGVDSIRDVVTFCAEAGIQYLTLYAFSTENWARPKLEVSMLMKLLQEYLVKELPTFAKNNIQFNTIGITEQLPDKVQKLIRYNKEQTQSNTGLTLTLALNYSGRSELTEAMRSIAKQISNGQLKPEEITEEIISNNLFTHDMPDPDLLIRTSGEMRVSNYLLWQISYAEIWITPVLWPDIRRQHIIEALQDFQKRDRRFGKVN
ncbi:MAG: isoprenyl transferase [Candidatus Auribacter fodinae]|uniref:Isoprenyl transferase n=1 Tax=Candidatus Auribacter fodinae TaxID=2093366 RepID=A0A3A4R2H9_9BACT|nr:MAG: isoprenyl transferase [Candidatus Auribacter fodinae]